MSLGSISCVTNLPVVPYPLNNWQMSVCDEVGFGRKRNDEVFYIWRPNEFLDTHDAD